MLDGDLPRDPPFRLINQRPADQIPPRTYVAVPNSRVITALDRLASISVKQEVAGRVAAALRSIHGPAGASVFGSWVRKQPDLCTRMVDDKNEPARYRAKLLHLDAPTPITLDQLIDQLWHNAKPDYFKREALELLEYFGTEEHKDDEAAKEYADEDDVDQADDNDEMIEPVNLFDERSLIKAAELTRDMLPDAIAGFGFDQAIRLGVEPALVIVPALTACAAAITDDVKLQPMEHDHTWKLSARLWTATVAESGTGKTPAMNAAVRPLQDIQTRWGMEDAKKRHQYEAQKRRSAKNDFADDEPVRPQMRRTVVNDFTTEALAIVLRDNERGVLVECDELVGLIGSFDAYRLPNSNAPLANISGLATETHRSAPPKFCTASRQPKMPKLRTGCQTLAPYSKKLPNSAKSGRC